MATTLDDTKDNATLTQSNQLHNVKYWHLHNIADPTFDELNEAEKCPRKQF